jgi:hypothetical protein
MRMGVTTGTRNLADISADLVTIKNGERSTQNPIELSMKSTTRSVFYRGVKSILLTGTRQTFV